MRVFPVLAACALAAGAVAACSGAPAPLPRASLAPSVATAPAGQAANPVPLLKRSGVPVPASVTSGEVDVYGDRYATADFPSGEEVTAWTYPDAAAKAADDARNPVTDSMVQIGGPPGALWSLTVTGVSGPDATPGNTLAYPVSPASIAARVGGIIRTR